MDAITESRKRYVEYLNKKDKISASIDTKEQQIVRLRAKKNKLINDNWWGDSLIRPIMELVKLKFPDVVWDDERLVPMGLRNCVSVFGSIDNNCVAYIAFTPTDLNNGIVSYDTGKKTGNYQSNSIGNLNGFDNISKPIENMEELYSYIQSKIETSLI